MLTKQLHADVADAGGATPPAKKNKKNYTPNADADFLTVCKNVNTAWLANPAITLLWVTQASFNTMITGYEAAFASRLSNGGSRPSITQNLSVLDDQMDAAVSEVKVYIQKKFKKANATAQYARYGIVHEHGSYQLPRDRDNRKASLFLMIAAIAADGFGAEEYGTAFWTATQTKYNLTLDNAVNNDGSVSGSVSGKNKQKKNITAVMSALRFVLRGNYPDTYAAVYREWGWQKEDY